MSNMLSSLKGFEVQCEDKVLIQTVLWALLFPQCSSQSSCSSPGEAGWCLGYICTCHLLLQHTIRHQHLLCSQQAAPLQPEPWLPTSTTCLCAHSPGEWFCSSPWAISPAHVHRGKGWCLWEHWYPALLQTSISQEIHRVQWHRKFPSREAQRIRLTFFQQRGYLDRVLWPEHCSGSCVADNSVISASTTTSTWVVVQL